jgi:hypothetical protein
MKTVGTHNQSGVSMVETLMVFPVVILMGLGVVHLGLLYQARANLEYAALMAAREGAVSSINIGRMQAEAAIRMAASRVGPSAINPNDIQIQVLNPTYQMFVRCGEPPTEGGVCDGPLGNCEIPNFGLQFRDPAITLCDGTNYQDANILRIRVSYNFDSKVPFMNMKLFAADDEDVDGQSNGTVISAVATVRMQTPARIVAANQGNW